MAKHYIIYETKNLKDGKIYVGMHETDNLNDGYLGSGKRLKRAIRYYGKEFFERKILFTFDNREDMIAKEIELVTEAFVKRKDTYNIMIGGKGGFISKQIQFNRSSEGGKAMHKKLSKERIYEITSSGGKSTYNKKVGLFSSKNKGRLGKTNSIEHNDKISAASKIHQSGKGNSQYGTRWAWINNKIESKKIKLSNLDEWLNNGWVKGRKITNGSVV